MLNLPIKLVLPASQRGQLAHHAADMLNAPIKLVLAIALLAAMPVSLQGAAANAFLDEIIVTSSRTPTAMRRVGTSVSVLDAETIEAHGSLSLVDILRRLPGLSVSSNGAPGSVAALRIRGEDGFRTVILVDGMRVADPSAPRVTMQMEHLPSAGVGRVEVLRGPQGLAYGADAGGVVAISSPAAIVGAEFGAAVEGGSAGSSQFSSSLNAGNQQGDIYLHANQYRTEGFNSRSSDNILRDRDGYENTTFHGRLGWQPAPGMRLELNRRVIQGANEYDGCFAGAVVHDCRADYQLHAVSAALKQETASFAHSLSASQVTTERQNFALDQSAFNAQGELRRIEYSASAARLPGFDLALGADLEQASSNAIARDNRGVYLEYLSDFSDTLFIAAGIRHDDNESFGGNVSYRVNGAYLLELDRDALVKFRGSFGTGFRAPSPYEVAYNAGPFSYPPAASLALRQEESRGFELGLEYLRGDRLHLSAVYFDQQVSNAIFFDLAGFSGYLQDIGSSSSKGIELSGQFQLNDAWQLAANYSRNAAYRPNGLRRLRRPGQLGNIGISYRGPGDRFNFHAFLRAARDAVDELAGAPVKLDDYQVLDISASYAVSDAAQLYGRVENALDQAYQEVADFNAPGLHAYIGLRFSF